MFFSSIPLFDVQILKNIFSIENCSNVGLKLVSILPSVYGTEAVCSVVFHIATSASGNTSVFYYLEYLWTQMARANRKPQYYPSSATVRKIRPALKSTVTT